LVPIEALLVGRGELALAGRWVAALDKVSAAMSVLKPDASAKELLAVAQQMKAVSLLFQNQVVSVLGTPLGFSDADGD
jgi:predicted lipoprotein